MSQTVHKFIQRWRSRVQLPVNYLTFKSAFHICFGATDQKHKTNLRFTNLCVHIYVLYIHKNTRTHSRTHSIAYCMHILLICILCTFAISGRVTSSMGRIKFLRLSVKFRASCLAKRCATFDRLRHVAGQALCGLFIPLADRS